jgi:hypothetical protein
LLFLELTHMSNKVFQVANTIVYKPGVPLRKKAVCRWIWKSVPGMVHVLLVSLVLLPRLYFLV